MDDQTRLCALLLSESEEGELRGYRLRGTTVYLDYGEVRFVLPTRTVLSALQSRFHLLDLIPPAVRQSFS